MAQNSSWFQVWRNAVQARGLPALAHDDDLDVCRGLLHRLDKVQAVAVAERRVEQHDLRLEARDLPERFAAAARRRDHLEALGAEHRGETIAQQAIVFEVERRGGRVEIEHLAWMQRSFGEFAVLAERLRGIVLRDCAAADELLQYLAEQASRLRHLRDIDLAGSLVSDAGLESMCELQGLERINLEGTLVTEEGVVGLSALPELKWINLGDTPLRWWTRWQLARNYPRLTFAKKAR